MNGHAPLGLVGTAAALAAAALVPTLPAAEPAGVAATRAPYRATFDAVVRQTWASRATELQAGCRIDVTGGGSRELSFTTRRRFSLALRGRAVRVDVRLPRVSAVLSTRLAVTNFRPRDCADQPPTHGDPPPPSRRRFANATARVFGSGRRIFATADHPSLPRTVDVCGTARVPVQRLDVARGRVSQRTLRGGAIQRLVIRGRRLLTRQLEVPGLDSCTVQTHVEWTLALTRVRPRR